MPLIFNYKGFKIRFYMNEENRMHVHAVYENDGEIKVWLSPALLNNYICPQLNVNISYFSLYMRPAYRESSFDLAVNI